MKIEKGATVAVVDGEKFVLFNVADVDPVSLTARDAPDVHGAATHSLPGPAPFLLLLIESPSLERGAIV